jgi:hypothetical protein
LFDSSDLKRLLPRDDISRKIKTLAILSVDEAKPKTVSEIKAIAEKHGLREIKKWNVSQVLSSTLSMAVHLPGTGQLRREGMKASQ